MAVTLASVLASAIDPVKLLISFGLILSLRRSHNWIAAGLAIGLIAYICMGAGSSYRSAPQLQIHFISSVALVGLAALILNFAGNLVGSTVGVAMSAASLGAIWFAISASTPGLVAASTNYQNMETNAGHVAVPKDGPAHSLLVQGALENAARQPEFRWLSMQTAEYQAAIFRGELPEPESEQRKVGLLIAGIRQHFSQDENISEFLLSPNSLPLLVELRSLLHDQLMHAEDGDDVNMLLYSSAVRISSRVQSILTAIRTEAKM